MTLPPSHQWGYTTSKSSMRLHYTQINNEATLHPNQQWGYTTSKSSMRLHHSLANNEATLHPNQQWGYTTPKSTMRLHYLQVTNEVTLPPSHQWGYTTSKSMMVLHYPRSTMRLQYLQVNNQTPGADEALLQKAHDLRTLQRRVAESPRWPSATLVVQGAPEDDRVQRFFLLPGQLDSTGQVVVGHLKHRMVQWSSTLFMVQMVVNTHIQHGAVVQYTLHVVNTHRQHGAVVHYTLHGSDGWLFHIQTSGHSGPVQWSNTLHDSESWLLQTHTEQDEWSSTLCTL